MVVLAVVPVIVPIIVPIIVTKPSTIIAIEAVEFLINGPVIAINDLL
jgi:hypothetical protein